ncbi:hypothetical protein [Acidipila sp. EB88]|uniref:hypothetical protein n=1 Tax=Acidipila sp. EB88 TaxID=2305226 RepID=UPI000F5F77DB|nr:hypothetical protein [Acidipila sp. EB88]RRA48516.1 hypothetical protein D1Y84_09665 [Acidipila sp. EB88]
MAKNNLLSVIDQAMNALAVARKSLVASSAETATPTPRKTAATKQAKPVTRRTMSEEGRQRIAEAQRKRWATQKRAAKKAARLAAK